MTVLMQGSVFSPYFNNNMGSKENRNACAKEHMVNNFKCNLKTTAAVGLGAGVGYAATHSAEIAKWAAGNKTASSVVNWVKNNKVINRAFDFVKNNKVTQNTVNWVKNNQTIQNGLKSIKNNSWVQKGLTWFSGLSKMGKFGVIAAAIALPFVAAAQSNRTYEAGKIDQKYMDKAAFDCQG